MDWICCCRDRDTGRSVRLGHVDYLGPADDCFKEDRGITVVYSVYSVSTYSKI